MSTLEGLHTLKSAHSPCLSLITFSLLLVCAAPHACAHSAHSLLCRTTHKELPPTPLVACTRSVLLDADGNAFLSDFGLSRPMQDASKLYTGTLAGTYFFM